MKAQITMQEFIDSLPGGTLFRVDCPSQQDYTELTVCVVHYGFSEEKTEQQVKMQHEIREVAADMIAHYISRAWSDAVERDEQDVFKYQRLSLIKATNGGVYEIF